MPIVCHSVGVSPATRASSSAHRVVAAAWELEQMGRQDRLERLDKVEQAYAALEQGIVCLGQALLAAQERQS